MKLSDLNLISEGLSSILYHVTSFKGAVGILQSDTMKPTVSDGSDFISFARTPHGAYHKMYRLIGVMFKIDGNKLGQRYKGKPMNWHYDADPDDWYHPDNDDDYEYDKKDSQAEDRVFVDNRGIQNFTKYVTQAILYLPEEYLDSSDSDEFGDETYREQLQYAKQAIAELKKNNIPIKVVRSEKGLSGIRRKEYKQKRKQNTHDTIEKT